MRLTLKTTMMGAFGLLVLTLVVQGGFAIHNIGGIYQGTERIATQWLPSVDAVNKLSTALSDFRIVEAEGVIEAFEAEAGDEMETEAMRADAAEIVRLRMDAYEEHVTTEEGRALFGEFMSLWEGYEADDQRLLRLSEQGRDAEAVRLLMGDMQVEFDNVAEALEQVDDLNMLRTNEDTERAGEEFRSSEIMTWAALIIGAAIGIAAMVFAFFGVARPIEHITAAMRSVSGGDLETEIPYVARRDEIGDMAGALGVFRDGLAEAEALRAQQAAAEEEAARRRKEEMHALADRFEGAVGQIVEMVSSASTELQASASTLSAAAEETNTQVGVVSQAAQQASDNVQTVAAAVEELSASASEIGQQVETSSEVAEKAVGEAGETNTLMGGLQTDASQIGDVINLINDIAEQTNLLALNATIEASRAGEAGKGFAVVAQEVKDLAAQTGKATSEIASQVSGMQGSTTSAAEAIEAIAKIINEISQVSGAIAAAVEEQRSATAEIAQNVQHAAHGAQEVTSNIAGVREAAQDSAAASAQVLSAAGELAQQAAMLRAEVDTFLTTVRAA